MRMITAIEKMDAKRYKVFLDGQPAFPLYIGELKEYRIKEGQELEEEVYRDILTKVLPLRARKRCLYLLQSRAYTEKKLREKLKEGCYPIEVIEDAISYVKSYHYIDDYAYAREYVFYHKEKEPRRKLEEKLRQRGISQGILEEILNQAYEDWQEEEKLQYDQAKKLLKKRSYDASLADRKEQQKQYAFLMRKGFSAAVIREVLSVEE